MYDVLLVLRLCERFGCLPSQLAQESADLLWMIEVERLVTRED